MNSEEVKYTIPETGVIGTQAKTLNMREKAA